MKISFDLQALFVCSNLTKRHLFYSNNLTYPAHLEAPAADDPHKSIKESQRLFGICLTQEGIDYTHPDFRRQDGSTRILKLWDQSIPGSPPLGYGIGTEYDSEQINAALKEGPEIVPSRDTSGHGTAVMGIAAGNGRASQGIHRGVATESDLIVVKLGRPREEGFPRTTELMQGIDYAIRQGIAYGKPLALNLSFGNNYGSHEPYN